MSNLHIVLSDVCSPTDRDCIMESYSLALRRAWDLLHDFVVVIHPTHRDICYFRNNDIAMHVYLEIYYLSPAMGII